MVNATSQIRGTGVSEVALNTAAIAALVDSDAAGACVVFEGKVRNHDDGRGVTGIEYSCHPTAEQVIAQVAQEIVERHPQVQVALYHRVGVLNIGDLAMVAAVSSAHRQESFAAIVDIVDTIKEKLPVWKRQVFTDDTDEWVGSA
ncbi:molybdenum cofactor biosynthesis protein MoaE [Arcanobacterium bovis]|uniref:Molybdenum cofactor biosynthesis protein MoaE n=1 Tax=Arcanobacterium bovis TaxID=2529275 RepID=A0A4Q9V2J6_9ACTO|nr:molybdenum cofactor biosynthesis protein MoaE [Arcanobacterium bovis]TBW23879.1 molybdenum cofactor biosynthesis protein MoaE [Arcanobacterium bovis]